MWLTSLRAQPPQFLQQSCNQKDKQNKIIILIETEYHQTTKSVRSLKYNAQIFYGINIVYQKYLATTARKGCASFSGRELRSNVWRSSAQQSRGTWSLPCLLTCILGKVIYIAPSPCLSSATLLERSVQSCRRTKHKTIVLSIITGSCCRRRSCLKQLFLNPTRWNSRLNLLSLYTSKP